MTAIPTKASFTGASVTQGGFKTAHDDLIDALDERLKLATTAVFLKTASGVGITASPDGTFHVHTASAGAVTAQADADDLVIENSANAGISILCPDANRSSLFFGSPADSKAGLVDFLASTGIMRIGTSLVSGGILTFISGNGIESVRIFDNGDIRLSAGTSALATGATGGFPGMSTMAGDPSGTPTNESAGFAPFCYDTTNDEFKVWNPIGNAWHVIAMAAQ